MITAHVNEMAIVLRYPQSENLTHEQWETLLDELKSHYIPSMYQTGKRSYADFQAGSGQTRVVIYFTDKTVTMDDAIAILMKWKFEVFDVRENPTGQ
jgi:protein subunit release factor A